MKTKFIIICFAYMGLGVGLGYHLNGNSLVLIPFLLAHLIVMFTCMDDLRGFIKKHDIQNETKEQKP